MRIKKSQLLGLLFLIGCFQLTNAQGLLDDLKNESIASPELALPAFKGNRISIGHSVETRKSGALEITFQSRYWNTPQETSNDFIADRMSARFGIDYALSDKWTAGAGYNAPDNIVDGFMKYRLLRQGFQGKGSPLSITALQTISYRTEKQQSIYDNDANEFSNKAGFASQLLIAHKFSSDFSLQIAPTFIHRGFANNPLDDQNHFAIGFGGRYRVANHVSVVSEYYYVANELESIETFGAFSLGVNWDVRNLLLQFKMTNNPSFVEDTFITQTRKNFNFRDGNFFFGFNATYYIQL